MAFNHSPDQGDTRFASPSAIFTGHKKSPACKQAGLLQTHDHVMRRVYRSCTKVFLLFPANAVLNVFCRYLFELYSYPFKTKKPGQLPGLLIL